MVVQWESVNYSHIFLCPPFSHCCVGRCYWRHPWIVTKRHLHGVANSSAYKRGGSSGGGFLACGVNLGNSASWRGQIFQYGKVLFQWAILGVGRLGEKAWKPEREYFKQTSTVCVPVSPAHQSDNQGHFITKALTNSGSIFITLEDVAISNVRALWSPSRTNRIHIKKHMVTRRIVKKKINKSINLQAKHYQHEK